MPSALLSAGAQLDKPQKRAPLHINRFFSGLITNRSPLREGAVEYLYEKFYSGARFDSVFGGQNTELTTRLTWARRPGTTVYNSQTFIAPNTFYPFRITDPNTGIESIKVIVDTPTAVYDGTGPNTKTLLFTKGAGAGQASFQSIGNTLYMGDGVDTKQWLWFPAWQASTVYEQGDCILDSNNYIWQSQGLSLGIVSTANNGTVLTVDYTGTATINVGDSWTFFGLTFNPSLNGVTVTVATTGAGTFTANYTAASYSTLNDSGIVSNTAVQGISGLTIPSFVAGSDVLSVTGTQETVGNTIIVTVSGSPSPPLLGGQSYVMSNMVNATWLNGVTLTIKHLNSSTQFTAVFFHPSYPFLADTGDATLVSTQNTILDGTTGWVFKNYSVRDWGIPAATQAPSVANVLVPAGNAWAASTYWWPLLPNVANNAVIVDSNGNIQLLTTVGTTKSSVPTWNATPGGTTADNTATWTNQGSATRVISTAYTVGQWIAVTVVQTIKTLTKTVSGKNGPIYIYSYSYVNNSFFFICTTAGTSSATPTANIQWNSSLNGVTGDGTVVWTNAGYEITRTTSATIAPTATSVGNVGNNQLVTNISTIADNVSSGGGTGFIQNVSLAGESGSSAPTWKVVDGIEVAGAVTIDNASVQWTNGGPSTGTANTGTWVYAYSFGDSITGHEGTASPLSVPILEAAESVISLTGQGDPNWATDFSDVLNIYRSTQGTLVPFRLAQIPAPPNGGQWQYVDPSPDPPNPASTLNNLISPDLVGTNAPPPSNLIGLTYHLSRIWGISGEYVVYSQTDGEEVGVGADSWSALNFFQMPSTPVVNWPSAAGLFIFTNSNIWLTSGLDNNGNPLPPTLYLDQTGILSPNTFAVNGSVPVIFASDSTNQILDPSAGIQYVGLPIADLLATFGSSSAYVTWHSFGTDQGYYVADGETGWYRVTPLSPPESGYAWGTKANIVGGCKCVKSIETSPGVRSLLIGSNTSGPILQRNLNTNEDNGTPYLANLVVGSIVLAQPGQCSVVDFLTTECTAVGSRVTVGILGDEISGTFESLTNSVPDPPYLAPSLSLFVDRWYFDELHQSAWLRHMMLNFSWPAENAANELYTYSVYGSLMTE